MFRKLFCWHKWGEWAYSRSRTNATRRFTVRRTCAKCGCTKYRKERTWLA